MNQNLSEKQSEFQPSDDSEVLLLGVFKFLQESWKKLAAATIVGAALGMGGWLMLGKYSAEYVLLNSKNNNYALDLFTWKMLQKTLPSLVGQIIAANKVPEGQTSIYNEMSSEMWWQKNITPIFMISKADAKDLATISKDYDGASTVILNLVINASGGSKSSALDNANAVAQFLRSGGSYLQLRSLLNVYQSQGLMVTAELKQKISAIQVEMGYQQERIRRLEDLHKRFPGGNAPAQQVVDAKDSSAKYLSLQTQIIAANSDLNSSKESLERLQKRLDQIAYSIHFLDQALPLQDQTFDGLLLCKQLLEIEANLRTKLTKEDGNKVEFLNELHAKLVEIQVRFTTGLEANTIPLVSNRGMIKAITVCLTAAFFLMLMALLGQRMLQTVKGGDAK